MKEAEITSSVNANMSLLGAYMGRQQYLDSAIFTTLVALLAATAGLLSAQTIENAMFAKLLPYIGLSSVGISLFAVALHRSKLRQTHSDGCAIQNHLEKTITLAARPFSDADAVKYFSFSAPDMVHVAIALLWIVVLGRHVPWIENILQQYVFKYIA